MMVPSGPSETGVVGVRFISAFYCSFRRISLQILFLSGVLCSRWRSRARFLVPLDGCVCDLETRLLSFTNRPALGFFAGSSCERPTEARVLLIASVPVVLVCCTVADGVISPSAVEITRSPNGLPLTPEACPFLARDSLALVRKLGCSLFGARYSL